MSLRTAVQQSMILTFAVLGLFIWLLVTLLSVMGSFDWLTVLSTDYIGFNAAGGLAGVAVIAVILAALVFLSSEVTEEEPTPDSWPPSE